VAAATVGVGPAVAAARTTDLLDRLEPVRVLVVGVAGALAPALRVADVVRPEIVVDVATGRRYAPGAAPPRPGARTVGAAREAGALVTVSAVGQRLPPALGAEAVAVDMETAAIAAACEERGVHWRVVRAVSDLPGGLDPRVATLLSADGSVTVRALLRLLGTEPGRLAALLRLGVDTRRAIVAATSAALEELHHGPA
jgi:adenosylhomocysteine nucleosidase